MRISDWSSDVCSSDLSADASTTSVAHLRRKAVGNDNLEIGVFGIERSDVEAQAAIEKLCFKTNLEKAGELRCERRRFRLWRENSLRETPALEPARECEITKHVRGYANVERSRRRELIDSRTTLGIEEDGVAYHQHYRSAGSRPCDGVGKVKRLWRAGRERGLGSGGNPRYQEKGG